MDVRTGGAGFRAGLGRSVILVLMLGLACASSAAPATGAAGPAEDAVARGTALLGAGDYPAARAAFEEALHADPSSAAAHLGLARAYYGLGEYSRAVLEFENVLRFGDLPPDMLDQAATYDQLAAQYEAGRALRAFYYAETGIGTYRENSSASTDIFGGAGNYDTFWPLRVGGGLNTDVGDRHLVQCARSTTASAGTTTATGATTRTALERQPEPSRRRRQPALRHARTRELPGRRPAPQRLGRVRDLRPRARAERPPDVRRRGARAPLSPADRCGSARATSPSSRGSWTHSLADGRTSLAFGANSARSGRPRSAPTATPRSGA